MLIVVSITKGDSHFCFRVQSAVQYSGKEITDAASTAASSSNEDQRDDTTIAADAFVHRALLQKQLHDLNKTRNASCMSHLSDWCRTERP
jgi:hypothetical protein